MRWKFLLIISLVVILILSISTYLIFLPKSKTIDSSDLATNNLSTKSNINLGWDHSPLVYQIDKKICGTYETRRVERAFEEITKASEDKILFKEFNSSIDKNIDINISCSYIEGCYKKVMDNFVIDEYSYEETYEWVCPYDAGLGKINLDEKGNLQSASIDFIGLGGFNEQIYDSRLVSGFSVGDCGYSIPEIREILKIVKGYSIGYDPAVRPAIYSYDYGTRDYSVMNNFKLFSGLSTYESGSCKFSLKDIDSWIKEDLKGSLINDEIYYPECRGLGTLDKKEWCQLKVSNSSKDEKGCASIKDSFKKDGCYQIVAYTKKEASICSNIRDSGIKDSCYFHLASFTHSISPCLMITNSTRKEWCYQNISVDLSDESNCASIYDYDRKKWCYEAVAQEKKEDDICNKQGLGNVGICVALANNSMDLCYSQSNSEFDPECVIRLATKNKDPNMCYKIQKQDYYSKIYRNLYCIEEIASLTNNEKVCEYIKDMGDNKDSRTADHKDLCYLDIAYLKEDAGVCSAIQDKWARNSCIWFIAKEKADLNSCYLMDNLLWKDYCIRGLNLLKNI